MRMDKRRTLDLYGVCTELPRWIVGGKRRRSREFMCERKRAIKSEMKGIWNI